jgi:dTDP-4-dehydrorhamnose 3,5-epimerase-like enzyme
MTTSPGPASRVQIDVLGAFRDARGCLFEPLNASELAGQRNVHVVLSAPGAVRGNHVHRESTEVTAVVGPCLVRLSEAGVSQDVDVPAGEVWRFTIPPGVAHAYRNTGELPMTLVSFNSRVHDPANPDTERVPVL